jgi:hypothetical protein
MKRLMNVAGVLGGGRLNKWLCGGALAAATLFAPVAAQAETWRNDRGSDHRDYDRNDWDHRGYDRDHDHGDVRFDIRVGERYPQYVDREVRVWVPAVYRAECEKVWVAPVYRTDCEKVWVPDVYGNRKVTWFAKGEWHTRNQSVLVTPGHYEDRRCQVLVTAGHYEDRERQVLMTVGHYETRTERVKVAEHDAGFALRFGK